MKKNRIVGNTPLSRSLNESLIIVEDTNHVVDSNGDKWTRYDHLVRNHDHPNYIEADENGTSDGVEHENIYRRGFVNGRTGEVHEGDMRVTPEGKAEPYAHSGMSPRLFHCTHYLDASGE